MKKWLLTLTLLPLLLWQTTSASAQEGCYSPNNCSPFNGFYVGGHLGFANYQTEHVDITGYFVSTFSGNSEGNNFSRTHTGWSGGLQIGYDWCCGSSLFGLVWDWDWGHLETKLHNNPALTFTPFSTDFTIKRRIEWLSTLRGRAGLVLNDALFYLTAGAVVADFKSHLNVTLQSILFGNQQFHHHRWGWTAGFGVEYAFWCHWSINAEVLYMDFPTKRVRFNSEFVTLPIDFDINDSLWVGRIGLNYRFSLCNWFW